MTNRDQQGQYQSAVSDQAILSSFTEGERPYQTASSVGEQFDIDRSTAYRRLQRLVDDGPLRKDEVGARAVVWWLPKEASSEREGDSMGVQRRIMLTEEDEWWIAREQELGLTTQGETRSEALESLDAVVAAVENDTGRPPTDAELRALGIDPDENQPGGELPEVLR